MRHRFVLSLTFALLLLTLAFLASYVVSEGREFYLPPAQVYAKNGTYGTMNFQSPGWTVLNVSCNGGGELFLVDELNGHILQRKMVEGHLSTIFVIPHEGSYLLSAKGAMFCTAYSKGVYPPKRVQEVLYILGGASSLLLAILLWRWWR